MVTRVDITPPPPCTPGQDCGSWCDNHAATVPTIPVPAPASVRTPEPPRVRMTKAQLSSAKRARDMGMTMKRCLRKRKPN